MLFLIILFFAVANAAGPQVYEEVDDSSTRQVRDPFHPRSTYQPPTFNYQNAQQQPDPRRVRYALQQEIDSKNILGKNDIKDVRNRDGRSKTQFSPTNQVKKTESDQTIWHRLAKTASTQKPLTRTSRKLKPNSYYNDDDRKIPAKRQDQNSQIIYVNPELIKQQFQENTPSEDDLQALSALIGQSPNTQLEGLKKILQNGASTHPQSFQAKDHVPVTEENQEEASSQINLSGLAQKGSLETIQAHLDQMAKVETEKALAKAQQQALAQVQAQHRAIMKQQQDFQKAALAKIAAHNQQIKTESSGHVFQHPLALPLKAEVVPVLSYAPTHHHQPTVNAEYVAQQEAAIKAQQEQAILQAKKALQESAIKAQQESIIKAQSEAILQQARKPNIVHIVPKKANLEKISVTKTHSVTQGRHIPATGYHEEVVVETQQQKVYPSAKTPEHVQASDHQYASRYAFGYRIKDVKKGNDFGHEEKRDGKSAKGQYHVLLPDGRIQKVEYYADPTGYHAKVTYENLAHH